MDQDSEQISELYKLQRKKLEIYTYTGPFMRDQEEFLKLNLKSMMS